MAIDIKMGRRTLRIIVVYLPHAGYIWQDVTDYFDDITALCTEADDRGFFMIIGGDSNATFDGEVRGNYLRKF